MSDIERIKNPLWKHRVENAYETILLSLRYDDEDEIPDLSKGTDIRDNTPKRATKAFDFLTSGYRMSLTDAVGDGLFEEKTDQIVVVKDIEFYSLCEHHMLPFFGKIHIGYIPGNLILGLSKLPRIVDMFSRRLQLQERLTMQVAEGIQEVLTQKDQPKSSTISPEPKGVAVVCQAHHLCMAMRGVEKQHSTTITNAMLGAFKDEDSARAEFMSTLSIK